jgi:hypothetical protein
LEKLLQDFEVPELRDLCKRLLGDAANRPEFREVCDELMKLLKDISNKENI